MLLVTGASRIQVSTQLTQPFFFFPYSSSSNRSCSPKMSKSRSIRIAIVGDVHDDWDLQEDSTALHFLQHDDWDLQEDSTALHFLQPDLVLFTGDYGNENVELVRSISNLDIQKSLILGNHDSWRTHQFSKKKIDRVRLQLECLGKEHVGYSRLDFPILKLSVVGGRPFSCGGEALFRPMLLSARYGVNDMDGSAKKICEAALGSPGDNSIVLLAHNGPTGLGSRMDDICGRDWVYGGGDHGDPDLAKALRDLKSSTQLAIPLVVFGHMHKTLAFGGQRKMIVVGSDGTIYLNGAIVPRVKRRLDHESSSVCKSVSTLRAFTLVEILNGTVEKISETWVLVDGGGAAVQEESLMFERSLNASV